MQDFSLVEVLESRHNLPEVVSDFGLCQHLPGFQDVSHGLREGRGEKVSAAAVRTESHCWAWPPNPYGNPKEEQLGCRSGRTPTLRLQYSSRM